MILQYSQLLNSIKDQSFPRLLFSLMMQLRVRSILAVSLTAKANLSRSLVHLLLSISRSSVPAKQRLHSTSIKTPMHIVVWRKIVPQIRFLGPYLMPPTPLAFSMCLKITPLSHRHYRRLILKRQYWLLLVRIMSSPLFLIMLSCKGKTRQRPSLMVTASPINQSLILVTVPLSLASPPSTVAQTSMTLLSGLGKGQPPSP